MKQVKDFRTFNKIVRKYYKRNSTKSYFKHNGKRAVSYWFDRDWVCYPITTIEQLNNPYIQNKIKSYVSEEYFDEMFIKWNNLIDLVGKEVKFNVPNNPDGDTVLLEFDGLLLTNRDLYYYGSGANVDSSSSYILLTMLFNPIL